MNTAWSRPTKYIVAVGLVLLGLFVIFISRNIIPLLIIAALLAFIVRPVIVFLSTRLRFPRGLAVAVTYLAVLLTLPLALAVAITLIVDAVRFVLSINYEQAISGTTTWLVERLTALREMTIPPAMLDSYVDGLITAFLEVLQGASEAVEPQLPSLSSIASSLGSALTITFGMLAGFVGNIFSSAVLLIFLLLSSIYMTLSAASYRENFLALVPETFRGEIAELLRRIGKVWVMFFRGQVTLMVIIGVIVWLGLTLLGVPGALSLAIIAGLLEIVPNLGPVVATIPAVVVALLQGSTYLPVNNFVLGLIVIAFYVVVQQLENAVIVPRVLGEAVELPALVVMTGVLVGGTTAGILGALLATPVIAMAREILSYVYRKMRNEPPFAPEPVAPPPAPQTGMLERLRTLGRRPGERGAGATKRQAD